jgi:hypothetical protein
MKVKATPTAVWKVVPSGGKDHYLDENNPAKTESLINYKTLKKL